MKKTTIKDVAKLAGVSVSTVSLVLNNTNKPIKEETKEKVFSAAKELNYTPNFIAKSLVTKKTNIVAIIVPDITNPYFSEIAKKIEEIISVIDYSIILVNDSENNMRKIFSFINNGLIDGILVATRNREFLNKLFDINYNKFVVLDEIHDIKNNYNLITCNNIKGGYIAIEHLIESNYKNIAIITGTKNTPNSNRRYQGAISKIKETNLNFVDIQEGDYTFESGYLACSKLNLKNIDSIFAFNDLMAYGAIRYLSEHNIKIKDDIGVIGYDNINISKYIYPTLTTIDQNIEQIAKKAINRLLKLITEEDVLSEELYVQPILIKGITT